MLLGIHLLQDRVCINCICKNSCIQPCASVLIFVVSRLSSRRASNQWSYGYFRKRPSPANLPVYPESGGQQAKEPSPPVSHSSVESNSSGVGNDSPPVSVATNLYPIFNATITSKFSVIA